MTGTGQPDYQLSYITDRLTIAILKGIWHDVRLYYDISDNLIYKCCHESYNALTSDNNWEIWTYTWDGTNCTRIEGPIKGNIDVLVGQSIQNPGFEVLVSGTDDDGVADNFYFWFENSFLGVIVESITSATTPLRVGTRGTRAVKCTNGGMVTASLVVIPGATYKMSFWTKSDGANNGSWKVSYFSHLGLIDSGLTGVPADWTRITHNVVIPTDCTVISFDLIGPVGAGNYTYFDDVDFTIVL